jgi:hypothetical protein
MVKQQCSEWPLSSPVEWETFPLVSNSDDGNESVDSLEACLRASNSPSDDDRYTFEKMEQALRDADSVLQVNEIDRRSPSNGSMCSDVGKFMDRRSNPDPVSRYSACGGKQTDDVIDRVMTAKTHALSTGTKTEDDTTLDLSTLASGTLFSGNDPFKRHVTNGEQKQSKDKISRALFEANVTVVSSVQEDESPKRSDVDDYVANMVADVKRRRNKKKVQQTYWQTYDSEDREVDGEGTTLCMDDEMDHSTLTGTFYSEDEDAMLDDDSMSESLEKQRRHSSKNTRMGNVLGLFENACTLDLCLGCVQDEVPNQSTKKRWFQSKNSRRKSSRRGKARDAREDATLEDTTVLSGYNREDATLAGTLLSGSASTRGGTLMSGSYSEMPSVSKKHPPLLSEPNFLAEDDGEEESELVADKAFAVIRNVWSGSLFQGSEDEGKEYQLFTKPSFQSKGEGGTKKKRDTNAIESESEAKVVAFTVKERLGRTRSQQLSIRESADGIITEDVVKKRDTNAIESEAVACTVKERLDRTRSRQLTVTKSVDEIITKDVKGRSDNLRRNKSMASTTLIRTPSQDELKAIYESICSDDGKKPPSLLTKAKSCSKTASSFRRQTMSKLAAPSIEAYSNEDAKEGALIKETNHAATDDTVEASNQRQQNALKMMGCEPEKPPTKEAPSVSSGQKKSFRRPKLLFSFKSNKKGPKRRTTTPSTIVVDGSSGMPASPARTAASAGTCDTNSIESRSHDDDDDELLTSYAALAITRTESRVLISI